VCKLVRAREFLGELEGSSGESGWDMAGADMIAVVCKERDTVETSVDAVYRTEELEQC
jgi:hypothetical protein